MKRNELLAVYDTKPEASQNLHVYASKIKDMGIASNYGVYVDRVAPGKGPKHWGIYLRDRRKT